MVALAGSFWWQEAERIEANGIRSKWAKDALFAAECRARQEDFRAAAEPPVCAVDGLERGSPRAADMGTSGPATAPDEAQAETPSGVAWSHPSRGITGDLGGPLSKPSPDAAPLAAQPKPFAAPSPVGRPGSAAPIVDVVREASGRPAASPVQLVIGEEAA